MSDAASASEPFLRVVKGDPTLDELAALVAVVAARRASAPFDPLAPRKRSAWGDPALAVRPVLHPGPGGWRRSVLPR